ncbi:MAG: aminotransferase class IV [Balneolaceae bacterium]
MTNQSKYVVFNGEFVEENTPIISTSSRGLMYGDGCFETLRSYRGKFLHFGDHFERLVLGLKYLGIEPTLKEEVLFHQLKALSQKNGLGEQDAAFRIQCVRRGDAGFGTTSVHSDYIITSRDLPTTGKDVLLKTVATRAIPEASLTRKVKLTNSINYIKAAQEASKLGGNDALMLTTKGFISETTIANIFWLKGDTVYTPSEKCDLLPGITRKIVLSLILNMNDIRVEEGEYKLKDLTDAEAAWGTNSLREIFPITSIDEINFKTSHPFIKRLQKEFEKYKTKNLNNEHIYLYSRRLDLP